MTDSVGRTARSARDVHVPLFGVAYACTLLILLTFKPLWLDEIIELHVTSAPLPPTLQRLAQTPGGSPLGYAGQHLLQLIHAPVTWASRLPSAIVGVAALIAFLALCRRLISRHATIIAGVLWCICPLALRYSLEGRPYMQGVLFAILAILAQIRLSESPSALRCFALAACLAAAVYSQPFALFAPLVFSSRDVLKNRARGLTLAAYSAAALAYLPWFLTVRHYWSESVLPNRGDFHLNASLFLTLLRECVGDGYPAAIAAILGAACSPLRRLWITVLGAVALVLVADARFHYFFATRQIIYILPFLILLMADSLIRLWGAPRYRPIAIVLATVFIAAAVAKDYRHLTDRAEDWARLATTIRQTLDSGCILTPATHEAAEYEIIDPPLTRSLCTPALADRVVVPLTTYTDPDSRRVVEARLSANGLHELSRTDTGFATVKVFARSR